MTITLILVIVSVLGLAFFLFAAARGRAASVMDVVELPGKTQSVDLLAFRNLTDPAEEQYLRDHLPSRTFRAVQRKRLWAAIAYLDAVARNAAVLIRLGEAARQSANPQVAQAGLLLANHALRVRLYATSARARFYAGLLLPGIHISPPAVSDSYEKLTGVAARLGYLQSSTPAQRTAAIL